MRALKTALPTLNALAVFESAARHSNLTRCAEELRVSQSAVSRHIANLEQQTGLLLFNRNGKKLQLTSAGTRLADAVGFGLGHIDGALTSLRREISPSRVTIACSYDLAMLWLVPRFSALRESMPGIEFRLLTSDAYIEFDAPEVDLSIRFGKGDWPGVKHFQLFAEEVFPVCAPSLIERIPRLGTDPKVLATAPLFHYSRGETNGLGWKEWFGTLGLSMPKTKHSDIYSSYIFILESMIAGHGAALSWRGITDGYIAAGVLKKLPGKTLKSKDGFHVVYPESSSSDIVPKVADWLRASCSRAFRPVFGMV